MWNIKNPHQGAFKKVLCVGSAGLLRSPALAWVLSNPPYNFNTKAVGHSPDYALITIDEVHIQWADAIVFVERDILKHVNEHFGDILKGKAQYCLDVPDIYGFRDEKLVQIIKQQLAETDLHPLKGF